MKFLAIPIKLPKLPLNPPNPPSIPGNALPPSKSLAPPLAKYRSSIPLPPPVNRSNALGSLTPNCERIFVNTPPVMRGMMTSMNTLIGCRRMYPYKSRRKRRIFAMKPSRGRAREECPLEEPPPKPKKEDAEREA